MATTTKKKKRILPRPNARMSLETSRQRINQKYGDALVKLARK